MDTSDFYWWKYHNYKYGRPNVQDQNSAKEWKALAEYAEGLLERAYQIGWLAAKKDSRQS